MSGSIEMNLHRRSRLLLAAAGIALILPAMTSPAEADPSRTYTAPFTGEASTSARCQDDYRYMDPDAELSKYSMGRFIFEKEADFDAATGTFSGRAGIAIEPPEHNGVREPAASGEAPACSATHNLSNVVLKHPPSQDDVLDITVTYSVPTVRNDTNMTGASADAWGYARTWLAFYLPTDLENAVAGGGHYWATCRGCTRPSDWPIDGEPQVAHLQARTKDGSRWSPGELVFNWSGSVNTFVQEYMGNAQPAEARTELTMQLHSITITG